MKGGDLQKGPGWAMQTTFSQRPKEEKKKKEGAGRRKRRRVRVEREREEGRGREGGGRTTDPRELVSHWSPMPGVVIPRSPWPLGQW